MSFKLAAIFSLEERMQGRVAAAAEVSRGRTMSWGPLDRSVNRVQGYIKEIKTHNVANFDGLAIIIGHSAKTRTKQAKAPRLQALNISMRSHLLTNGKPGQLLCFSKH